MRKSGLILICLLIAFGCSKNPAEQLPANAMVKTQTTGKVTQKFYYDSLDRIIRIESYYMSDTLDVVKYAYYKDTVYEYRPKYSWGVNMDTLHDGTVVFRRYNSIHILNGQGLFEGNNNNDGFMYMTNGTEFYHYDSRGFLETHDIDYTDAQSLDTLTNDGKNILSEKGFQSGLIGNVVYKTEYNYFPLTNTLGNKNFGINYLGKGIIYTDFIILNGSKNLVRSEIKMSENLTFPDESSIDTVNYNYEFDAFQRVIKRTTISKTGGIFQHSDTTVTEYSYY